MIKDSPISVKKNRLRKRNGRHTRCRKIYGENLS